MVACLETGNMGQANTDVNGLSSPQHLNANHSIDPSPPIPDPLGSADKTPPLAQDQQVLVAALREMVTDIIGEFPPNEYEYIGIGRSPTPIMALLQERKDVFMQWIPLSEFRPQNPTWTIRTDALGSCTTLGVAPQQLSAKAQRRLFEHFDRYLVQPRRPKILMIDYAITGKTLLAAQEQLEMYFDVRGVETGEIHALAICRSGGDFYTVQEMQRAVSYQRSWWLDFIGKTNAQRESFGRRWHIKPTDDPLAYNRGRDIAGLAFSRSAFDGLAPHGEYRAVDVPEAGPLPDAIPRETMLLGLDGYLALKEALLSEERDA